MTADVRIWCGEQRIDAIDPRDRGLAYGDGLFETMRVHDGRIVWWQAHRQRLARGCAVLRIAMPDAEVLRQQVDAFAAGCADGVLKLILTRGVGQRGYAASAAQPPTWALMRAELPPPPPSAGLRLRWCATRLAIQPQLAGIKHLNRLEQVLARGEWSDPGIDEGLLCDTAGRVVSATAANVFVLRHGRWLTPPVRDCGIAGTCRNWLLRHVAGAAEAQLWPADIESADAVILCNAVRGILPVAMLGERRWQPECPVVNLIARLAEAEPAFASADTHGTFHS